MFVYLIRRLLYAVLTIWAVSIVAFVIIQLPPGDYVTAYLAQLAVQGSTLGMSEAENLRAYYGLDRPMYYQYYLWLERMVSGDFNSRTVTSVTTPSSPSLPTIRPSRS